MDIVWDGITRTETLPADAARIRHALADAATICNWPCVLELICRNKELVNTTRPDGPSLNAPLHQAAHGGAPVEVVRELIGMLAWRTLQNACGERPVDVAERQGHRHLLGVLTPEYKHHVPMGILLKVQAHFHAVIRDRAEQLVRDHSLRLPELEPLLELDEPQMWFEIPGMYGGFSYGLQAGRVAARLVCESSCRVVGGSGERHEITSDGTRLVEEVCVDRWRRSR